MADKKVKKKEKKKEGFWQNYKYLIFGLVGAVLLISSMSVQNVILYYETEAAEKYAVKMDYSAFGMCIRCYSATDNAGAIVEKAIFAGSGKEKSVQKAADGLKEIAGEDSGVFYLKAGGLLGNSEKTTDQLINFLKEQGYTVKEISQ